jgi:oligopeptide transport system substrate-binding protein
MFKKFVSILIILSTLTLIFCSCGKSKEISLVIPITSDPLCLDPQIADSDSAKTIINNCYEGLVRLNDKYEIIPGVAETWDISSDGLTYTFHLRQDSKWQLLDSYKTVLSDKDYMTNFKNTVTAYDFQFAFRRALDLNTKSDDAEKLFCISNAQKVNGGSADKSTLGVTATDDSTLIIKLERADEDFLRILTLPLCMPCNEEFFNATHAKYGLELKYTFCNGPFYLSKWTEDNSLTLRRNDGYKGNSKAALSAIYFSVNKDETSVIKKLKQSAYDCAFLSTSTHNSLENNKKITQLSVTNIVTGLCFNCKDETLTNINLRKAILMMTKFDDIAVPSSSVGKASGVIPDCCRFGSKKYRDAVGTAANPAYNESGAVELWKKGLDELGYDNATITISCTEEYAQQMQNAIQNWQLLLGTLIIAKVNVVSADELKTAIKDDKFQIAVSQLTTKSSTAVDSLKPFMTDNDGNIFNFSDEKYDALINGIIKTASADNIKIQLKSAEQYIIDNAVFCPLFNDCSYLAVHSDVSGIYTSPAFESICFINGGHS